MRTEKANEGKNELEKKITNKGRTGISFDKIEIRKAVLLSTASWKKTPFIYGEINF